MAKPYMVVRKMDGLIVNIINLDDTDDPKDHVGNLIENLERVADEPVIVRELHPTLWLAADGQPIMKEVLVQTGTRAVYRSVDLVDLVLVPETGAAIGWTWDGIRAIDPDPAPAINATKVAAIQGNKPTVL